MMSSWVRISLDSCRWDFHWGVDWIWEKRWWERGQGYLGSRESISVFWMRRGVVVVVLGGRRADISAPATWEVMGLLVMRNSAEVGEMRGE